MFCDAGLPYMRSHAHCSACKQPHASLWQLAASKNELIEIPTKRWTDWRENCWAMHAPTCSLRLYNPIKPHNSIRPTGAFSGICSDRGSTHSHTLTLTAQAHGHGPMSNEMMHLCRMTSHSTMSNELAATAFSPEQHHATGCAAPQQPMWQQLQG